MSTVQRIARNTTVLLVAQVASYLLSFFYMMYAARYLEPANFGILSFAIAFTGIFAIFGDFGLQSLMVREIARDRTMAPKYLANVGLMKVIMVAVAYGLIALTINLMGHPRRPLTSFTCSACPLCSRLSPRCSTPYFRRSRGWNSRQSGKY